jgi:hypothetical protein
VRDHDVHVGRLDVVQGAAGSAAEIAFPVKLPDGEDGIFEHGYLYGHLPQAAG